MASKMQGTATDESLTKIHGFKKHQISSFLKDRHPYLYPPFEGRYNPKEVFHAVFDRSIPKLVEILEMNDLPAQSYREAFLLLNEMASHQENKLSMIDSGLVHTCLEFMGYPDAEVKRESTNLLGSLVSVRKGRERMADEISLETIISTMLTNEELMCREVCGWMLCRLCSGRDGIELLIKTNIVDSVITSFRMSTETPIYEEAMFIIYLLECSAMVLQVDDGILSYISNPAMKRFHQILTQEGEPYKEFETRIRYLCLHCTALMAMNNEGKEESIYFKMLIVANKYLKHEDEDLVNAAVRVIMFSSIHLSGKEQAAKADNDEIIQNLISLLVHPNSDIVRNAEISIVNISDLPKGFRSTCKYFASHLDHLDKIFGPSSIVPLYALLFKIDRPPFLTEENKDQALKYVLAISHFINDSHHQSEALTTAIEKTCKIVDRMLPLLLVNDNRESQKEILKAVLAICFEDEVNRISFQNFVSKHGSTVCPLTNTSLDSELGYFDDLLAEFEKKLEQKQEGLTMGSNNKRDNKDSEGNIEERPPN